MTVDQVIITRDDRAWHEAFHVYVQRVFPSISFRAWVEHGGWDERYAAFACVEGGEIVANASVCEMDLVLHGRRVRGLQLGAVGTLPSHRGRGLSRSLIERILERAQPDDLAFLFANDTVLDFYPRFGFTRVRQSVFRAERQLAPQGPRLRALDLGSAADRALLQRIARSARPTSRHFGVRDYGSTVLWYWANFFPRGLRYAEDQDAIFVVQTDRERLRLLDVLAAEPLALDLEPLLPRLLSRPVTSIELGFTPERYLSDALPVEEYVESPLFVRGAERLPAPPFKYPMLAQT
jgi:predicted N-acetyltransferase YhbS